MKNGVIIVIVLILGLGTGYYLGLGNLFGKGGMSDSKPAEQTSQVAANPKPAEVKVTIVGIWKSTDDAKFTREFHADGSFVDKYANDSSTTAEGQWKVFVGPGNGEPASLPLKVGVTYVKLSFPEEAAFFSLTKLTSDSLELVYLDRGGTLSFTKVR